MICQNIRTRQQFKMQHKITGGMTNTSRFSCVFGFHFLADLARDLKGDCARMAVSAMSMFGSLPTFIKLTGIKKPLMADNRSNDVMA